MTPLHLTILLHYYVSPEQFSHISETSRDYERQLVKRGLLEDVQRDTYPVQITPRGKAHITQICRLEFPQPVEAFRGADGKIIQEGL